MSVGTTKGTLEAGVNLALAGSYSGAVLSQPPAEICDLVLDHLHNDRATLMQCALVCKAWTHRSQHHLFTRLTYHSRITRSPRDFAEFLLTRPNIAGHVLSLEILDRMSLSLAIVRLIILALPHLRTLLFRAAMISSADDADIALGQRPNPRTEAIKKLTFMNCMAACDTLYSILGIFPAIGTLVLDDRCGGLIHCQPASPAIRDLAIERIETSSVSNSLLAALVHGSRMEETITSAKIIAIGKESDTPEELGEALQSMTSLRTLQLLPLGLDLTSASNSTRSFWDRLGLARLKSLEVLELPLVLFNSCNLLDLCIGLNYWNGAVPHLPPSLQQLHLAVHAFPRDPVTDTDSEEEEMAGFWADHGMDEPLSNVPPHIRIKIKLDIMFGMQPPVQERDAVKAFMYKCLPEMAQSGRLAVFE